MKSLLVLALNLIEPAYALKVIKPWRQFHADKINSKHHMSKSAAKKHYQNQLTSFDTDKSKDKILILSWWAPERPEMRQHTACGIENDCWVTNDKQFESTADGVIFDNTRFLQKHASEHPNLEVRNPDQFWIFWAREAASKGIGAAWMMEGAWDSGFNLTTSYRRDSDIPRPFGNKDQTIRAARFEGHELQQTDEEHIKLIMDRKNPANTSYAAWVVSNCDHTAGAVQRFEYGKRLLSYGLKLDGFGECWNNTLIESPWSKGMDKPGIITKYKFYLAFENSMHCDDYISEKFWRNSLQEGAVPIVFGPHQTDVKEMAPPKSFIHVEDFKNPQELVNYLDYLDGNDTAYLEYHAWRNIVPDFTVPMMGSTEKMFCGACDEVRKRKKSGLKKMIKSVASWWWMNTHDDMCIQGSEAPDFLKEIQPPVSMADNEFPEIKESTKNSRDGQNPKKSEIEETSKTLKLEENPRQSGKATNSSKIQETLAKSSKSKLYELVGPKRRRRDLSKIEVRTLKVESN